MGQSRGYRVALSLLWGRAVAMGWRCHCYGAESWLWGGAVPIGCFSYGLLLPLWGSAAPLWGRAVAMGWRCHCYGAEPWLWVDSAVAMGQSCGYGVALSLLWGIAVAMGWRCTCNDAVLPLGGSAVPILAMTPCCR